MGLSRSSNNHEHIKCRPGAVKNLPIPIHTQFQNQNSAFTLALPQLKNPHFCNLKNQRPTKAPIKTPCATSSLISCRASIFKLKSITVQKHFYLLGETPPTARLAATSLSKTSPFHPRRATINKHCQNARSQTALMRLETVAGTVVGAVKVGMTAAGVVVS